MQVGTLYEAHLVVRDLDSSARFYKQVLGFTSALVTPDVRFYWTESDHSRMFALWQQKPNDEASGRHTRPDVSKWVRNHLAFHLSWSQFWDAISMLKKHGIAVKGFEDAELSVHCWVPALSAYFSDPDGHALELISVLRDQPRPELGVTSWSEWQRIHANQEF